MIHDFLRSPRIWPSNNVRMGVLDLILIALGAVLAYLFCPVRGIGF